MNNSRASTNSTFVKILIAIPALILMFGLNANADTASDLVKLKLEEAKKNRGDKPRLDDCKDESLTAKEKEICKRNAIGSDNDDPCSPSQKRIALEAKKEIETACSDAGIGNGKDCYNQAMYCATLSKEDDSGTNDNISMFSSALSAYTGTDMSSVNANQKKNLNGCPQYSGEQYKKRLKEINDELKEVKKDITDLKKEGTDLEKDTQKDMKDTQKDIQDAQKEMQEKGHEVDDDTRKQMSDLSKEQTDLKKSLSSTDQNIVSLRGKMAQSETDKADQLISLNDAMIKDTCVSTYEKALYENQQSKLNRSLSFAELKSVKQRMLNIYNTCILKYQQQRINLLTKKEAEQAELKAQITAAQDDMQETQRGIDSAQTQSSQIQTAATAKKNEAQQQLATKIQTAQTSLQTAQTNMQKQQQNMQSRYNDLNKRQNTLTAEMNAMGTEPDADATTTPRKAAGIINGRLGTIQEYAKECCVGKNNRDADGLCKDAEAAKKIDKDDAPNKGPNGGVQ